MAYATWSFGAGTATTRHDVTDAVREVLRAATLYQWAGSLPGAERFTGRLPAYGVNLGTVRAVVRHAHRGGYVVPRLLGDRYLGRPRFLREIGISEQLRAAGLRTPAVLAGVRYRAGVFHRADVATERVDGTDLFRLFFAPEPLPDELRRHLIAVVARAVRLLHDAGWVHQDLQLRNVLIAGHRSPSPELWFLDVESCRRSRGPADERDNVERFFRSWNKWNVRCGERLGSADRRAFLDAWQESDP